MKSSTIKYIVISDVHLGHRNNSAKSIIDNIKVFFNGYAKREDGLDIIFIAGDLFDSLLDLSKDDIYDIIVWLDIFLNYCYVNNIKLRILEGTPSHDWKQSKLSTIVHDICKTKIDILYVDTLYIEKNVDLGINILYIPDEWNTDTSITYNQALSLMKENKIDKVDIVIMHGQFQYQLPNPNIKAPKHIESDYLNITKYLIHIGHVHQYSVFERIIAQGSFDRLCHGDEIPKGGTYNVINKDGTYESVFIENKLAKTFVTLNVKEMSLEKSLDYIEKKTKNLRVDSFVRIKAKKDSVVFKNFELIKKKFIDLRLSKFTDDEDAIVVAAYVDINLDEYEPIILRPETIEGALVSVIESKYTLDADSMNVLKLQLKEAMK